MMTEGSRDTLPKEDFIFDPFGLHAPSGTGHTQEDDSSTRSPHGPPEVNRLTRPAEIHQQPAKQPVKQPVNQPAKQPVKQPVQQPVQQPVKPPTPRSAQPVTQPTPRAAQPIKPPTPRAAQPVKLPKQRAPAKPTRPPVALPPRLVVRFTSHEEVSSVAQTGVENEGSSEVFIQGKLYAQVTSSDALKNVPFCVSATTPNEDKIQFQATEKYSTEPTKPLPRDAMALIHVPKIEYSPVGIGSYSLTEYVRHMPLLVERKITIVENIVRVAVQVRSKLSNQGDMKDFTIAVAVPERVNSETVEVSRGDGVFDDLKRTIKWVVPDLPKGESFMVSAQAHLWSAATSEDHVNLKFPVLLRCHSDVDQISNVELRAVEADGFPSTVSFSRTFSFRLLHRLP